VREKIIGKKKFFVAISIDSFVLWPVFVQQTTSVDDDILRRSSVIVLIHCSSAMMSTRPNKGPIENHNDDKARLLSTVIVAHFHFQ